VGKKERQMIVRKRRGKNEIMPIKMTRVEYDLCMKMGLTVEQFVKEYVAMIAKKRRWKWWFKKTRTKNAV
jgi:hypothetical protein